MAGGLFGRPLVFNEKCIFFALICMMLFMYKPNINNQYLLYFTLFVIFVVAYVAMAWYDYYFNCDIVPLKRGKYSFTGLFKPPPHVPKLQEEDTDNKANNKGDNMADNKAKNMFVIYALHLLVIVPILGYVAYYKNKVKPFIYPTLGVLAIFTAGYHGTALMLNSH